MDENETMEGPLHGYRGETSPEDAEFNPAGPTLAISRQVGARGGSIARRVGAMLGWQVYTQELLEYMAVDEIAQSQLLAELPSGSGEWVDARLEQMRQSGQLGRDADMGELPRLIFMLAARGHVVLIGRGAGFLLPRRSTLHVRVVASRPARERYMEQWLRLSSDEASRQVGLRDARREEFLYTAFGPVVTDPTSFDMTLDSAQLGEELCVQLLLTAAQARQSVLRPEPEEGIDAIA